MRWSTFLSRAGLPATMALLLLEWKSALYERNDRRLREAPNPPRARRLFAERLTIFRRVERLVTALRMTTYAAVAVAALSLGVKYLESYPAFGRAIDVLAGTSSSLAVLLLIGLQLGARWLDLAGLELSYLSAEGRMRT